MRMTNAFWGRKPDDTGCDPLRCFPCHVCERLF